MSSCEERTEVTGGPLFFFDQPDRRLVKKRSNMFNDGGPALSQAEEEDGGNENLSGETCGLFHPMDAYRRSAPLLLNQLDLLLGQHQWADTQCVPHGITNILSHTWEKLTVPESRASGTDRLRRSKVGPCPGQRSSAPKQAGGHVGKNGGKPASQTEKHKKNSRRAGNSCTAVFSLYCSSCTGSGWIIEPIQPCFDKPHQISLCQWVLERLQAAKNSGTLHKTEQNMNTPLLLHHYGDTKAKQRSGARRTQTATIFDGIPQIPAVNQPIPGRHKLHYRINDGASFIYYPSGCIAVCHSRSGPPCGGFYTNIFSDSTCPFILGTITAFGHGSVTHPVSAAIKAVWDHGGGLFYDQCGNVTKVWSWLGTQRHGITIQVSDLITVRLHSGLSAMLNFTCGIETVELKLSFQSHFHQSKTMKEEGLTSSDAHVRKANSDGSILERTRCLTGTPKVSLMVQKEKRPVAPPARWRRGGCADRELRRLQRRARGLVEDWLEYYRASIGIKCPNMKKIQRGQLWPQLRKEVQAAGLPTLIPPGQTEVKVLQPTGDDPESEQACRPPPVRGRPESPVKPQRSSDKALTEDPCVTVMAPAQIYSNIPLQAALLGKEQRSRRRRRRRCCCCSAAVMPAVTDLEYDEFVKGQPAHSQQMLVVCVTPPHPPMDGHPVLSQDALGKVYRKRNKDRSMPCTQGQLDSFRLVRYEMSTEGPSNTLLQQRHNAAPGMVLMYIRGKLLFVGHTAGGSAQDLQRLIIKTRRDYRSGRVLPPDYKFRYQMTSTIDNHDVAILTKQEDVTTLTQENKCRL